MQVILTVGDHDQNGLVALAQWRFMSESDARAFIDAQDAKVSDDMEPDIETAPFTFILDLMDGPHNMIDNGKRILPTQVAMALAPEQVQWWLNERPEPDLVCNRAVPELAAS